MTATPEEDFGPIVPVQTDNSPRPSDGDQDLDQSPGSSYDEDGTPTVADDTEVPA